MRKLWLIPVLTLVLTAGIHHSVRAAEAMAETILQPFRQVQVIRGEFEQQKKLPVFANPFISTGRFVSVRDHGLIWETITPAPSTLIMTPGRVVQKMNDREQQFQASGTGYDGLGVLLPALLDGDMEALEAYFSVAVNGDTSNWSFELEPKSPELSSMIKTVSVHGTEGQLQKVTMSGPDGDLTRILFESITMSSEAPDAADLAQFN